MPRLWDRLEPLTARPWGDGSVNAPVGAVLLPFKGCFMSHPILGFLAETRVRQGLRRHGHSLIESIQLAAAGVTDARIESFLNESPEAQQHVAAILARFAALPVEERVRLGAIGDGSLIKLFTDFLNSELGKALVAFLMQLILGGL